jgi:hypothetical protein
MDPVKLNHYRLAAENGFWKHKRTAFQEWLGLILTLRSTMNSGQRFGNGLKPAFEFDRLANPFPPSDEHDVGGLFGKRI